MTWMKGGMLFEKVVRRLCPCFYTRSDEKEHLCSSSEEKEESMKNLHNSGRKVEKVVGVQTNDQRIGGNESFNALDYWGGSFDLVRPQPLYALPTDRIEYTVEHVNLLTPPMYWKKAVKSFSSTGPPVVQEENKNIKMNVFYTRKGSSIDISQKLRGNDSETLVDVRSVTPEIKQVSWLTSKTHSKLGLEPCENNEKFISRENYEKFEREKYGEENAKEEVAVTDSLIGYNKYPEVITPGVKNFRVFPDISYGVIVFSAAYHSRKKILLLKIDSLENLSLKGRNGNAYSTIIKLSVSPSDKYLKSTKVLGKCTCPEVKEDFTFSVRRNSGKVLRMSVFDVISQNPFNAIGHALLSLDSITSRYPKKFRMKLYRHTQPHETPGNLSLSLTYDPEEEKLTVIVSRGKNLVLQGEKNVKMNTYVKGTLYNCGKKFKSKRTRVVMNSRNPKFNSIFTFRVKEDDVDDLIIVISVRLKSFLKDVTIGRVILGPFFITDRKKLTPWGRVFLKQEPVSHWFRLYL